MTLVLLGDRVDLDASATALGRLDAASFDVVLGGIGAFPRPRAARVLWLGVRTGREQLVVTAEAVCRLLDVVDERPFRPHLTLARFRTPHDVSATTGDHITTTRWRVEEIVLFESVLGRGGPSYRAHARITLS